MKTINPYTEKVIETYDPISETDAIARLESCHDAFLTWKRMPLATRGNIIRGVGKALTANKEKLAQLMTQEMGKLLSQSYQEVDLCAQICEYSAGNASEALAQEERDLGDGQRGIISHEPLGVIYGIQPWNYPSYQVVRYSIANLMAGNGVLLKHAESVTGTGQLLAEIYREGGLPENLFQALIIEKDTSEKLIEHRLVRGVTLTGSPGAGRIVGQQAAKALKKTVLELGSNDAFIVLGDADLETAVEKCVMGRTYNNGETCIAAKRFIVVDEIYDDFKAAFVKAMSDLTIGDPTDDGCDMGPMAREDLRDELHEQVEQSVANGATILCGGQIPDREGFFYPATVLGDVAPGQPAYDDELFGPVAALIRAKDDDDAMRIANDSKYGLGGGILTTNQDRAVKMAIEEFDTGMVFINGFGLANPKMPFGGVKESGYGREHGGFGMREFVNTKAVMVMG
jgi:succinate-semialdehyde dehydrogenase/glutarate-semialdehyde dehydrogenase